MNYIPLVFCFDAQFVNYAAVSIYTAHKSTTSKLKIYCLVPVVDILKISIINELALQHKIDLVIIPIKQVYSAQWKDSSRFSKTVYARLLIPDLISEEKILYLDSDVIVQGDLSKLYNTDVSEHTIAGVYDEGGAETSKIPRVLGDLYINSGVLVMNLSLLRKNNFLKKCQDIYEQYNDSIVWPDQCIINKYAEGNKVIIDSQWNRCIFSNNISPDNWFHIKQNSIILHFVGPIKPWMEWCNPLVYSFWWEQATKMEITTIPSIKMKGISNLLDFSSILDKNGDFKTANLVKTDIIRLLLSEGKNDFRKGTTP